VFDIRRMKAKIVLMGDGGVGKSSLIRRFVLDAYEDRYLGTVGTKVSKIRLDVPVDDGRVEMDLVIFDIMGQRGFRDMVKETYFHGAHGYLAVCDLGRRESLVSLHDWVAAAMEHAGQIPGVIIVNKVDLAEKQQRAFSREDVETVARIFDASVAYASAKAGTGVDEAFSGLAVQIVGATLREERAAGPRDFRERVLALAEKRGSLGANREMVMKAVQGVSFAQLERELEALEDARLARVVWHGPGDFTVYVIPRGERSVARR